MFMVGRHHNLHNKITVLTHPTGRFQCYKFLIHMHTHYGCR